MIESTFYGLWPSARSAYYQDIHLQANDVFICTMTKLLSVATAAIHPDQLSGAFKQQYPRVDYIELQRFLDANTLDYSSYGKNGMGKLFRRWETYMRSDVFLAAFSWWKSHGHSTVFTWSA
jgi:hypothetical protein